MPYERAKVKGKYKPKAKKVVDQVREVLRYHHYSLKTEEAYVQWIVRFIHFSGRKHPRSMGKAEIEKFLSHLAINRDVAASTQNQAFQAIKFLYERVLNIPIEEKIEASRSKKAKKLPTVLSLDETKKLFDELSGTAKTMSALMYGSGLRVSEVVRLRVGDLDFENHQLIVRDGKGNKDRATVLPDKLKETLKKHLKKVRTLFETDLAQGNANVYLPTALSRKYTGGGQSWVWQYVFPSRTLSRDPRGGAMRRHHVHRSVPEKAVSGAASACGIEKRVSCHTLRHSFATRMLEKGVDIRRLQELLGHKDVRTTMIYTHVMNKNLEGLESPFDDI